MTIGKLLSRWNSDPTISANIHARHTEMARKPVTSDFPEELHPNIIHALYQLGITGLFSHQLQAWIHIKNHNNLVVATGTASGKSFCYNLPIVNRLVNDEKATALYLFPTKALAQDQASALKQMTNLVINPPEDEAYRRLNQKKYSSQNLTLGLSIPLAVYDGDTPEAARAKIRSTARIIFSNPDMLHVGILPHHTSWDIFLSNLSYIVIDEMHIYRGVFGSHVANVFRRLSRILKFYGSYPQYILTSATIANPSQLAQKLINQPVDTLINDGSVRGKKNFFIYNPPIIDQELGLRRSAYHEAVRLSEDLLSQNIQTIIFCRSRRTVELILSYLRERSSSTVEDLEQVIRGYRSGYLAEQRREIESGIRNGKVRLVSATNALELGIDIGGMEAVLLIGYPGTIAATRQQIGRAGRGTDESLAVLVATPDPIDQFFVNNPDYLIESPNEEALINPNNTLILLSHIQCAAFELPFTVNESFGDVTADTLKEYLEYLLSQAILYESGGKYFWMADKYPAQSISIRTTSVDNVLLNVYDSQIMDKETGQTIGQIDRTSAYWMVHPDAIYLHEGRTYLVDKLDLQTNQASLHPIDAEYYTVPKKNTDIQLVRKHLEENVNNALKATGEIIVNEQVIGFRKVKWYTHENIGSGELELPPTRLNTTAYWFSLEEATVIKLRELGAWSADPINYGPDWNIQKKLARERDGFRCQVCGITETDRAHDVHHKIPFRQFQTYEQANRLENLVTLCLTCHKRVETNVRIQSGLAGLAFTLRHLAPIYLMSDRRDIGVHSDPQSTLADGYPTIIIYDQIPDGIGFSMRLFELHDEIIDHASRLVQSCQCKDGCPSCVGPGGEFGHGGKHDAIQILSLLSNPTDH